LGTGTRNVEMKNSSQEVVDLKKNEDRRFFFSRKGKDLERKIEIFLENAAEIFSWRIPFML
jgi:hypothetical protein